MGDLVENITGVMTYQYGFYRILPLTKVTVTEPALANQGPSSLVSARDCSAISIADYNVENLMPDSEHMPYVADHIINILNAPDLINIQEVQDNSGSTDDGVTAANETLTILVDAIRSISDVTYDFATVDTEDGTDGGQPGGNIRVAFLYRPDTLRLAGGLRQGGPTDANEVLPGPTLKYNPGRIDPANTAWENSRKPIAAAWEVINGNKTFFTVNVHWASKGGSTSLHGDARPPVNGAVEQRMLMANVTGVSHTIFRLFSQTLAFSSQSANPFAPSQSFISDILAENPKARVIAGGDFNEFDVVGPMKLFEEITGMKNLDEVIERPVEERYTYLYDMNTQSLDHMLVSKSLQRKSRVLGYEHLHLNSWAAYDDQVSDHDPSVALFNMCNCRQG